MTKFVEVKTMGLRDLGQNEEWLQGIIAKNPRILGLGDVRVRDIERRQADGGRLDLLLESSDNEKRYEVEILLGKTDESHIIRAIEYWDVERKRYPNYDHCAVIVAEDITSRFFNVIGLFNGHIPMIALKLTAIERSDGISLLFTKVLDRIILGKEDDETDDVQQNWTREDWVKDVGEERVKLTEAIFTCFGVDPYWTQFYAGIMFPGGSKSAAVKIYPKQGWVDLNVRIPQSDEKDVIFDNRSRDDKRYRKKFRNMEEFDAVKDEMLKAFRQATKQSDNEKPSSESDSD